MTHPQPPHPSSPDWESYWSGEVKKATRAMAENKKRIESSKGTKNASNDQDGME